MARPKKKPLRGSVRQNTIVEEAEPRFGFGARLALLVLGVILFITFMGWLWHSDWPRRQIQALSDTSLHLTQKAGFAVADVSVEGRHYTDRASLFEALGVSAGSSTFAFVPTTARDAIIKLPWTKDVTVVRSLPDKIIVRLTEREPIARWQHDGKTTVIDTDGQELLAARPEQFANLPLVVGNAAPEQTQTLLGMLQKYPVVARVLKAAVRVGERRWNFYIHPNLLIRLPQYETETALEKLTKLIQEQKILDRNIIAIDLRFPDRMVVEPGTQPATPEYGETSE
ncbi:MAG: FtsQ-type POTRA domain-containing protein [Alphaproteobacteria bacterium]|nr:FtsQ-type POTRA domain-containing protein [Alphaproteobacteria bacterium]